MLAPQFKSEIDQLLDRFWSGGIANPLTAIEQITYLIFLKRLEDSKEIELPAECCWSRLMKMEGEEALQLMRIRVFEWLKQLPGNEDLMRDAVFALPSASLLKGAMDVVDELFVFSRDVQTLGEIYEYLLGGRPAAGKSGQFRTPLHIIRAMCHLMDPQLDERVCDPACRTAEFLIGAYQHILMRHTDPELLHFEADGAPVNLIRDIPDSAQDTGLRQIHFRGFDSDQTLVRLGTMNLILHGLDGVHIENGDALGSRFQERLRNGEAGEFDVILANPPFGGILDQSDIGESLRGINTNKTELLYVELVMQLLRIGGRAAVIVPEDLLFGSSSAHRILRKRLLTENEVDAIVSLPAGVFQPYTGVKTSILLFTKGGRTDRVWFYDVTADGYTLNARRAGQHTENDLWDLVLAHHTAHLGPSNKAPVFAARGNWFVSAARPSYENGVVRTQDGHSVTKPAYAQPRVTTDGRELATGDPSPTDYVVRVPDDMPGRMFAGLNLIAFDQPKHWFTAAAEIAQADYNLCAARYKASAVTVSHDPPAEIIRQLQALEVEIQQDLDKLLAMVENQE